MTSDPAHVQHQILLFADTDVLCAPLAQALADRQVMAKIVHVASVSALQTALATPWDRVLVAYPLIEQALALLARTARTYPLTLLYRPEEEAQAVACMDPLIDDLLPLTGLSRLAWQLARRQLSTQPRAGESQLHQLEARFQAIVEGFGDAILLTDGYQIIRYVNSAFTRIFGYTLSATLGRSLTLFLDDAERTALQDGLAMLGQSAGAIQTVAHRLRRADGAWAAVETTGHSMLDPNGQVFVALHVRDLSDKKLAEAALLESERQLQLFVEHVPAAIAMLDRDLRYLAVSQRWLSDYHLGDTDIIGRAHYAIFPDIPASWREIYQRCLQGESAQSDADPFPRADGTLDWVRWEVHPWRNGHGAIGGIMILSEVITERVRAATAEREQRLLAETLRDTLVALSASTDSDTVMQQILDYSAHVVPSEAGAIVLFAENEGRVAYTRGHSPDTQAFFKTNPGLFDIGAYIKGDNNQAYYLASDTQATPDWRSFPAIAWIRSSLGVPIVLRGEPIGLLTVDSATPHQYGLQDVANLQLFARYAALALERVRYVAQLELRVQERTAELEAAKTRVEAILHNSPDSILLIDKTLVIQQANRAFQQLFVCEGLDCVGHSLVTFIHADDRPTLAQLMQAILDEQQSKHVEMRATRHDGTLLDIELSIGQIRGDGLVCVMHDISVRKAQERELRYHASLQESVGDAVIVTDLALHVRSWNQAAERIYGWSVDEALGQNVIDLLQTDFAHAADRERRLEILQRQGWWKGEVTQLHRDGTLRYVLSSFTLLRDEAGNPYRILGVDHDITELRQAQQRIVESEARYRLIAENLTDVITKMTADGIRTFVTPSCYAMLGYQPAELVGQPIADIIHPEDHPHLVSTITEATDACDSSFTLSLRLRHQSGRYLWCEVIGNIVRDPDSDAVVEIVSVIRNITKRRTAEDALRQSAAEIYDLYNRAPCGYHSLDKNGVIVQINDTELQWLGCTREEVVGKVKMSDFYTPESRAAFQRNYPLFLKTGLIKDLEFDLVGKDGVIRHILLRGSAVFDAAGQFQQTRSTLFDITERKLAERSLQESEAKYRQLVETMNGGLLVYDTADRLTYVNNRFCAIVGRRREELLGTPLLDHVDQASVKLLQTQLARRRRMQSTSYELVLRRQNGQPVHVLSMGSPLRDRAGKYNGGFAVMTDITPQKQAEAALRQALERERELNELKTRFVSIASHEFRTPLATISATTETIKIYRARLDSTQLDARLDKILMQVDHMKAIMDDVLQLERIQTGRIELRLAMGDLQAFCHEIVEEFRSHPTHHARILYDEQRAPVHLPFDSRLMRHVITNLISNALKYSAVEQTIRVDLHRDAELITLQVCDQGIGIPEPDLKHLFDPFHRARNVGTISGTGLGLSITKEAVERHNGQITVTSTVGVGTTVTVVIPIPQKRSAHDAENIAD